MAVTGVVNLAELISNQSFSQSQNASPTTQTGALQNINSAQLIQDSFTASSENVSLTAQDAGLFQLNQLAAAPATAGTLLVQAASQTAQNLTPTPVADTANNEAVTPQVQTAAPPAVQTPAPAQTPAPPQDTTNASAVVPQVELQSLNGLLLGLGLNNTDISYIDLVASVTKVYNPTFYSDLVQQDEAQAAEEKAAATQVNQPAAQTQTTTV